MQVAERYRSACTSIFEWLNIHNHDLNALLCQLLHYTGSNTIAAACDNDYLFLPIIRIIGPIVNRSLVQEVSKSACQAKSHGNLEPFQGIRSRGREVLPFGGVSCCEEEREGELWVEDDLMQQFDDAIKGESCISRLLAIWSLCCDRRACAKWREKGTTGPMRPTFARETPLASERHLERLLQSTCQFQ